MSSLSLAAFSGDKLCGKIRIVGKILSKMSRSNAVAALQKASCLDYWIYRATFQHVPIDKYRWYIYVKFFNVFLHAKLFKLVMGF